MVTLQTTGLKLRPWQDTDLEPFAALNADPRVMEHYQRPLSRPESDALANRLGKLLIEQGFGFWALEITANKTFIGCLGLMRPTFQAHFTPCIDIGWRLAAEHWGRGYATEAATAALSHAFDALEATEVVSFTVPENHRSTRVMERLGMQRTPEDDFNHPQLPEGHRLRAHVLYRLSSATHQRRLNEAGAASSNPPP